MTKALQKALDLYPVPDEWIPTKGFADNITPSEAMRRVVLFRESLTSLDWPQMVRAFRTVMQRELPTEPRALTAQEKEHHLALLNSEVNAEFAIAGDLIEQADGLLDIIYVAIGALKHMGLTDTQIHAGFAEVQASNMTKVQDDLTPLINDGVINPHEPIGKVLKTHNYIRPNLAEAMGLSRE